ncbi:MAG: hypothetical protein H5T34_04070 [Candidatus Methanomethyliales bacterium]|nr:hypothetical protein [Candidatus Methanomethylicales archaeon]
MGQAEVTPVEIRTSITRLPHGFAETVSSAEASAVGAWGSSPVGEAGSPQPSGVGSSQYSLALTQSNKPLLSL